MDRLTRSMTLTVCGFGLLFPSIGCRATRPEVPPGRPYARDGRQQAPIGFSTQPHPLDGSALTNAMPDSANGKMARGTAAAADRPDMSPLLGGNSGAMGPPGTSGRDDPNSDAPGIGRVSPAGDERVLPAGAPVLPRPSISPMANPGGSSVPDPTAGPTGPADETLPPEADIRPEPSPAPSQVVQPDMDTPGRMGQSNSLPSPN